MKKHRVLIGSSIFFMALFAGSGKLAAIFIFVGLTLIASGDVWKD